MGTNRSALTVTMIATLLAWGVWGLTITQVDPNAAGWLGTIMFSCSLFAAVSGSATVIGLYARRRAEDHARAVRIAIRQGALTALAVVTGILLASQGLFTWLNMFFLIIALTLLELFCISLQSRRQASGSQLTASR